MANSIVRLSNFIVNTDIDSTLLPINVLSSGLNYRLVNGAIESFNGESLIAYPVSEDVQLTWETIADSWKDSLLTWESVNTINAGHLAYVQNGLVGYYVLLCRDRVLVFDGATWSSISSIEGYSTLGINDELRWGMCQLGSIPIINNFRSFPEYWSPQEATTILKPLPFSSGVTWATRLLQARVIKAHGTFLFALNLQDGSVELPTSYRWSHPADTNGLPFTWDETDLSSIAGAASLEGDGGAIIDGLSLRNSFVIYSEHAINILDFVGGEFVWNRRILSSSYGLLATNCVIEVLGNHYFMTESDILRTDGNSIESILYGKFQKYYADALSTVSASRAYACVDYGKKEIWFCYPTVDSAFPSTALIFNWNTALISQRDLNFNCVNLVYAPLLDGSLTWKNVHGTWAVHTNTWINPAQKETLFANSILGSESVVGSIFNLSEPTVNEPLNTILERTGAALSEQNELISIVRVWPKIHCRAGVTIQVCAQSFIGDDITWSQPRLFQPFKDSKLDFRLSGKYFGWRITSIADVPFILASLDIEYVSRGRR